MIKLLWEAGSLETLSPHTQQPRNGLAYTINDLTKYNPQKHLTPCMILKRKNAFFFFREAENFCRGNRTRFLRILFSSLQQSNNFAHHAQRVGDALCMRHLYEVVPRVLRLSISRWRRFHPASLSLTKPALEEAKSNFSNSTENKVN